jgi:hypothetical protein
VPAVYGPFPAPGDTIAWCEGRGIPYLSPSTGVLGAGRLTIALAGPQSLAEVERVFRDDAAADNEDVHRDGSVDVHRDGSVDGHRDGSEDGHRDRSVDGHRDGAGAGPTPPAARPE